MYPFILDNWLGIKRTNIASILYNDVIVTLCILIINFNSETDLRSKINQNLEEGSGKFETLGSNSA